MLKTLSFFGEVDLIQVAIERLKFAHEISESRGLGPLYVAFSGGKDSIAIAKLAEMAGVPHELHYNITGIDPPEVIYFMRNHYPNLIWNPPRKSMWQLIIEKKMPPTRKVRYCCAELKERGGDGKVIITGVRWAESTKRKNTRRQFETKAAKLKDKRMFYDNYEDREQFKACQMKKGFVINPIVDWTDTQVWEFIHQNKMPYCELYDQGETRIGCIGCPMGSTKGMVEDFRRYPKFKDAYIRAFDKMLARYDCDKQKTWKTGEDVLRWWIYGKEENHGNQITFLEEV